MCVSLSLSKAGWLPANTCKNQSHSPSGEVPALPSHQCMVHTASTAFPLKAVPLGVVGPSSSSPAGKDLEMW